MYDSESAILYHGPSGQEKAFEASKGAGRLLGTFGSHAESIKADVARSIVEMMSSVPVGDAVGVLLIGPLDTMHPAASDVLLKSLEEFNPKNVRPILWADDIGSVRSTIISRCLDQWCAGPEPETEDEALISEVDELVTASLEGNVAEVIEKLTELQTHKERHREILRVTAVSLSRREGFGHLDLWKSIRGVLGHPNVSFNEAVAAYLLMEKLS